MQTGQQQFLKPIIWFTIITIIKILKARGDQCELTIKQMQSVAIGALRTRNSNNDINGGINNYNLWRLALAQYD